MVTGPTAADVRVLLDWYRSHARDLPWRRTRDPYAIWVSEIMLQQTQVRTVIPYWERWMRELPTVAALAGAPEERVLKLWEGLGYYRRARQLRLAAQRIVEEHGGRFPGEPGAILALPGVGRYTAGAVASIAFDLPEPILDGNIVRVLSRYRGWAGDPNQRWLNRALWDEARAWVEAAAGAGGNGEASADVAPVLHDRPGLDRPHQDRCSHLNQALMELGATVCVPRGPECGRCPLSPGCRGRREGTPEVYPGKVAGARVEARQYLVAVVEWRGRVWVRQREVGEVNGGLWEFPSLEVGGDERAGWERLRDWLGGMVEGDGRPLGVVRHAITRYRITQRAFWFAGVGGGPGLAGGGRWCGVPEVEGLAMSRAHRRIADAWKSRRDELRLF